jgi:cation:H+ antiporter
MLLTALAGFALGLLLLLLGADSFLKGASGVALRYGISPFVIGLTIVGFGTSAPEMSVNLSAAWRGSYDLALGNVVGSNIANIGLILGCSALVAPLVVQMRLLKVEAPLVIAVGAVLWILCLDGALGRGDALLLLAGFAWLLWYIFRTAREEPDAVQMELAEIADTRPGLARNVLRLIVGLALLVYGAGEMVESAVVMARLWGMTELVIGLTVVAIGTSLPELASSLMAAFRGQSDVALGNVMGSNLFNILLILGATAGLHPLPVASSLLWVDLPVMIGFSVLLYLMLRRDLILQRREGVMLLLLFAVVLCGQVLLAAPAGAA